MPGRVTAAAIATALLLGASAPVAHAAGEAPGAPTPVQFTTARGDAPQLRPGMYQTARPTGETTRYARIHRPKDGSVTVAIFGDVDAAITTADGTSTCSSSGVSLNSDVTGFTFVYVDGTDTKRQSFQPDACASATDLVLTLQADSSSGPDATPAPTGPVQLAVTVEPRIAQAGAPATKAEMGKIAPPSRSGSDQVLSSNFAAPTTLAPGSYQVSLKPAETVVARVRVGWGQRLAASVGAPRNGTNVAPGVSMNLLIAAFSPQWAPVGSGDGSALLFKNDATEQTAVTFTAPVRAANRNLTYGETGDVGTSAAQWTTAAGWYYVAVRVAPNDAKDTASKSLPARLNLQVVGTAGTGPTYTQADGSAVAAPPAAELSQGGRTGSGAGTATVLRIAGTALVLVIAGAAVAVLLRRRA